MMIRHHGKNWSVVQLVHRHPYPSSAQRRQRSRNHDILQGLVCEHFEGVVHALHQYLSAKKK